MVLFRGHPSRPSPASARSPWAGCSTRSPPVTRAREALCFHESGVHESGLHASGGQRTTPWCGGATKSSGHGPVASPRRWPRRAWARAPGWRCSWATGPNGWRPPSAWRWRAAVLVPVNTLFEAPEIEHVLRHSDSAVLVYQERLAQPPLPRAGAGHGARPPLPHHAGVPGHGLLRGLPRRPGTPSTTTCSTGAPPRCRPTTTRSWSTRRGRRASPRACCTRTGRRPSRAGASPSSCALDPTLRVWSAFPFFWTAGYCMVMGATLAAGACLVLQELFEPGDALALLESERVTNPHAWPHQLAALESHPDWAATRPLGGEPGRLLHQLRPAPVGEDRRLLEPARRLRPHRDLHHHQLHARRHPRGACARATRG